MVEFKEKQILAIKDRLNKAVDQSGLNINKLKDELNNKYDYEIHYETLSNTLKHSKLKSLDMICVIALCRYFNLDIAYVLSEPDNPALELYASENQFVSERYSILDDPKYLGDFYGYFYSPKQRNDLIDDFHLSLKPEHGKTVARLTVTYHSTQKNNKPKATQKELVGTPILVKPSSIYIVFTEGNGQFIIFSYSYVVYNENTLYFRRGAMITRGRDANRQPLLQSFVLFKNKLSEQAVKDFVPGFLLLYDSIFHVPAHTVNELSESHSEIAHLLNDYDYIFKKNLKYTYEINEAQLLASVSKKESKDDVIKALQLLKAHATDATRIYFPENEDISEFSKQLNSSTF